MPLTPQVNSKDVVFIQRSDDNSFYGEIHVSGALLIPYIDETGHLNADDSASFFAKFPVSGSGGSSGTSNSSSWASHSFSSDSSTSASWASQSLSSSFAFTASFALNA